MPGVRVGAEVEIRWVLAMPQWHLEQVRTDRHSSLQDR